ncbi:MAG: YdcF family protein [Pseudomonadota bacterium]|nr:YdcF family protein [Pseudomonadota bacterium]
MTELAITRVVAALMLPPGGPIVLGLLGVIFSLFWLRLGYILMAAGLVLAYAASIPLTASLLNRFVQQHGPLSEATLGAANAQAIVVLAGGLDSDAPEYGEDTVALRTLGRVRYAAQLARRTGLPVLASGGGQDHPGEATEAELMKRLLEEEFGIADVHMERTSRTTRENAFNSAAILRSLNIDTVLLVTNAAHMQRSAEAFRRAGIRAIPAPTLFFATGLYPGDLLSWIPRESAVREIHYALHECLGRLWYWLRDGAA